MTTNTEIPELFAAVEGAIEDALLVSYDGCHKIYLAMDEMEANWFRENYEIVFADTPDAMLAKVIEWYEDSCDLRFVTAVSSNPDNPIAGFTTLISQFEDQDENDEDEDEDDLFGLFEDEDDEDEDDDDV